MEKLEQKEWYLWPCEAHRGAFNMAVDDFLARQIGNQLDRPVLRFFIWNPFCISLGYHQKIDDIDLSKCEQAGIEVVRRPTGGRAILHAEELTYSVVYPFRELDVGGFYRLIHLPFVQALRELGVPAEFQKAQADFRQFYKTEKRAVCFATSAQYEVEAEGRKLIGSAQRVYEGAILQHGSLLLGPYHEKLVDFLQLSPKRKEELLQYIQGHTAYTDRYRPGLTAEKLAREVARHFQSMYGIHFLPLDANSELRKTIEQGIRMTDFSLFEVPSQEKYLPA